MTLCTSEHDIKVTLGMCVRNSGQTVRDALVSVFEQEFPHNLMELIIVDGLSQDDTLRIIRNCVKETDIPFRIFYENEGLGKARQIVVDRANGDYVIWVDGDMVLSKNFVMKQVQFMEQNPMIGIAKGRYGGCTRSDLTSVVAMLENVEFVVNTASEGETASKALGTSGCIYRVDAIREVGGFDSTIPGVGEDMDAENRIRRAGWSIYVTTALFQETRRKTWRSLWNEYFWHGKGGYRLLKKDARILDLYKMLPPVGLAIEMLRVPPAYRLTGRKAVLILPLHYTFKRIAWFLGFLSGKVRGGSHQSHSHYGA